MKRSLSRFSGQSELVRWVQYIAMVLAFIGLWQLLLNGSTALHRLF